MGQPADPKYPLEQYFQELLGCHLINILSQQKGLKILYKLTKTSATLGKCKKVWASQQTPNIPWNNTFRNFWDVIS